MKITFKNFSVLATAAMMAAAARADIIGPAGNIGAEPIALALNSRPTHSSTILAPSSQLTREQAFAVATALSIVTGKDIVIRSVTPTGSMLPYFDEHALLMLEAVPFDELKLGDVVTFFHPRLQIEVVHRLLEKRGKGFWSKGDHNISMDDILITPENYHRRLAGVIYFQSGAPTPPVAALTATAAPAVRMRPKPPG